MTAHIKKVKNRELETLTFMQREELFVHHTYEDEQYICEMIEKCNKKAISLMQDKYTGHNNGILSKNILRNFKYQFVVDAALISRASIKGGLPYQLSYSLSDLYIQKADECKSVEELNSLHLEMLTDYLQRLYENKMRQVYSKPIQLCLDYIYVHLHEKITVKALAVEVGLNSSYLSTLFMKTMHISISDYIRKEKLKIAKLMLKNTNKPFAEISNSLSLGSQSHFTCLIKASCGCTPREYRSNFT